MRNRVAFALSGALAGVLSALVGVAAGHLVAAVTQPDSSPVIAVGSTVIDLTPTPMKEWAIRHFGSNDKTVLIGSVLVGVLLLAAVAGLLARRRFAYGAGLLLLLVLIPAGAALSRPGASAVDVLPSLAAAVAGFAALAWLTSAMTPAAHTDASPGAAPGEQPGGRTSRRSSRRAVLVGAGAVAGAAAVMGGAGRWITSFRTRAASVELPAAADPAPALPRGLEERVPGISSFRTPTDSFYRVDTRLTLPIVDLDGWTLAVDGDVEREVTLTFDDLLAMPLIERDITLTCVSNDVGGSYLGSARWLGVRLTDVLDRAGIDATGADQILSTDVDGMTISTPLDLATDGRDAMIAVGMNGRSLTREHGFPARMVVPGLYGFISACKWISRMTLTTYAEQDAYWTRRDWATDAPIKISSRIDTPQPLSTVPAGRSVIGGVAWAQHQRGVRKVEVRIDGHGWQEARLGPDAGNDYWRQWYLPWTAEPGQHALAVRTTDGEGDVQTAVRTTPFPAGSSGIQEIVVNVA
jgi:DMSO/TMAO reductase YedYZ molybdopterin-dependent catalytic subunit